MDTVWSNAFTVLYLGMGIVFTVLVLLVFLLSSFSRLFKNPETFPVAPIVPPDDAITQAEAAAIAMAVHLFHAAPHDEESYVITIDSEDAHYSPWNSKIYGLNNKLNN